MICEDDIYCLSHNLKDTITGGLNADIPIGFVLTWKHL